jgi:hypothetical protein
MQAELSRIKKKEIKRLTKWKIKFARELVKKYPSISKKIICEAYNIKRSTLYYKQRKILKDTILKTKIKLNKIFNPYY